jgi:molecular chaperone HtpG
MAKRKFKAEVAQLLHLIIHSLYSHKEVFLRELISNASDALDRLKYLTLTDEGYKGLDFDPRIDIEFDEKDKKTLTVSDTGIGMSREELAANLGTIASSGTRNFASMMTGDVKKDASLIGQFGVGFYSSFMVSERVEVISMRAGDGNQGGAQQGGAQQGGGPPMEAHRWISDGKGSYEIAEAARERNGTTVICHLNDEGSSFVSRWEIENIVKKYSNHIPFPIYLHYEETVEKDKKERKVEQVNAASAFWKRPKAELKEEDYREFYKTLSHDTEDPLLYIHTHAEGAQEYSTLFYIPQKAPWDMFHMDFKLGVKLYVKRVFITDEDKELMPTYLRFVKGVIDSEDLPLNVSREVLQKNRILTSIKNASVKKILNELGKLSTDKEAYQAFFEEYRKPLKEGLYQDFTNREQLLELVRYKSTKEEGYTSLSEYKSRMKPDQKAIYYITGENGEILKNSPLLEVYKQKDIEVLVMDDEIDEIVVPTLGKYKETDLKSVNRSDAAKDLETEKDKKSEKEIQPLITRIKDVLSERVKDVRPSVRLSDSPSCIVADESDPTIQMQHILKSLGQKDMPDIKPILEINPNHEIIKKLKEKEDETLLEDVSWLLLEQAMLIEGAELRDPAGFARRLNRVLSRAI